MRLKTGCTIAVLLNFTNRLVARFHRNGIRIYALSLLLQHGVDQRDQSNQANQSCDYKSEDRRPYRYVNSQKQGGKSNHSGFKDTTNDEEASCLAKVAVPVRYGRAAAAAGASHQKRNWGIKTMAARTGIKE